MPTRPAPLAANAFARLGSMIASLWPRDPGVSEAKASAAGPLIALQTMGQPAWTPRDYAALAREGMMQNAIVYRSVRMIAEATASVPLLLYERDTEIIEHPLLDLLARPNRAQTGTDLMEAWLGFLIVAGNGYLEAVALGGELRELHALRPDRVKVVPGTDGWPDGYEYTAAGSTVRITGEAVPGVPRVLQMRLFHPANDHYGLSPIEAAASAIDLHNAAARWNKALLDNSARPSGALVYSSTSQMTADQFERLKSELEASFQGTRNAGRPLLLEGGLDWKAMSLSPRDLDFMEAKHAAAREIALAIGVPPMLLGIPGDNTYANYAEAQRAFWRQTVLPLVARAARALTMWLAPAYGGDLRLEPDLDAVEALSPEREALWARLDAASFLTDDEKRAAAGYGPKGEEVADDSAGPFAHKYNPNQPRVPAGNSDGGQWTDGGGGDGDRVAGRFRFPFLRIRPAPRPIPPRTNAPVSIPPGKIIRNKALAGKKHPRTGIPFDKQGFPDFSGVSQKSVHFKHTGKDSVDFATANSKAGFKSTPPGWTWHHHQNGRTMQLVPRHIHFRTGHTGSQGLGNLPGRKSGRVFLELKMIDQGYEKAVADFEVQYAISLPQSYRRFLVSGAWEAQPERTIFNTSDRADNPDGVLQQFFGLGLDDWSQDVVGTYEEFLGGIPERLIPIGCDPGANLLFLDLRGEGQKIVFWDHGHYWGTGEWRERDLYHVADSFDKFLLSLKPDNSELE